MRSVAFALLSRTSAICTLNLEKYDKISNNMSDDGVYNYEKNLSFDLLNILKTFNQQLALLGCPSEFLLEVATRDTVELSKIRSLVEIISECKKLRDNKINMTEIDVIHNRCFLLLSNKKYYFKKKSSYYTILNEDVIDITDNIASKNVINNIVEAQRYENKLKKLEDDFEKGKIYA